jgi:hypothetical protein
LPVLRSVILAEELLKRSQRCGDRLAIYRAQPSYQSPSVNRPNLFEQDKTKFAREVYGHAISRRPAPGRQRGNNDKIEIVVNFRRRNDHARTGFAQLPAFRGIKTREPNIPASYHVQSLSPSFPNSGQTKPPSPAAARALLSSAQPSRNFRLNGERMILPLATVTST